MKYTHWLKINNYANDTDEQYFEIQKYLNNYPEAKAMLYSYNSGNFNKIVKLECNQCYNDLDMDVNSMRIRLERLRQKPHNITERKSFEIPEYIKKKISLNIEKSDLRK